MIAFIKKYSLLSVFALFMSASPAYAVTDRATALGFVAHKATYEIKMVSRKSSTNVSNINGTMIYQWQPSCDEAWVTQHNFDMLYQYTEIPPMRLISDFSTRETFDGSEFNFSVTRKRNDQVFEEVRGSAGNSINKAVFTMPADLAYDLPAGTLFPTSHTIDVVEQIKQGVKFKNVTLCDGSDDQGPVDVNTFVLSKAVVDLSAQEAIDQDLIKVQPWRLRLAFFPLVDAANNQADYELTANFHENGVISHMKIDYTDFSVEQTLTALEKIEEPCGQ